MNNLEQFLNRNGMDLELTMDLMYDAIIIKVFSMLCKYIEETNYKEKLKKQLISASTIAKEVECIDRLVKGVLLINLNYEELHKILVYIKAYFRKNNKRSKIDEKIKFALYKKQGGKCKFCGKYINYEQIHCDHYVPFILVGDELEDNYNILCSKCNLIKNRNTFEIKHIIRQAI